jgi:hypothetical protein
MSSTSDVPGSRWPRPRYGHAVDASIIINLGLLVVTGVATVFAGYQAIQARTARGEAESARDQAARHEQAALQASERSANAAERSATARERQAEMAERTAAFDAWEFHYAGAKRWMALNRTGHRLWAHVEGNDDRTRKRMRSGQDDLTEVLEGVPSSSSSLNAGPSAARSTSPLFCG